MKYILLLCFVFMQSCSTARGAGEEVVDAWETGIPSACRSWDSPSKINEKLTFEIARSSYEIASYYLSDSEIMPLESNEVKEYLGYIPAVEGDVQPYLVRALYGHSGTGVFNFNWCREGIAISHGSLGRYSIINRTAFIIYLPKRPSGLYLEVSIDE